MAKIVILTGNHLCHNPRVQKEAQALCEAGHQVEVLGGWVDVELARRDVQECGGESWNYVPVVDLTGRDLSGRVRRVCSRVARELGQRFGRENSYQLGYAGPELLREARLREADLYLAHSEQGMWAAAKLLEEGAKAGVDMEDWFSEDLPPASRKGRPVGLLRRLERELLSRGAHRTCTSEAMSMALAQRNDCKRPTVVYNVFPWAERETLDGEFKDRRDPNVTSIHWYSQTVGPGRGLEDLFAALELLGDRANVEVHLRGTPCAGCREWLNGHVNGRLRERVFVHGLVSNRELLSRIAEHDIGFAGEMKQSLSRDLTVTNKVFHYLLGGLAVVASDTAGQREIYVKAKRAIRLYPVGHAAKLADAINGLLASPGALDSAKEAALEVAQSRFCWEKERSLLCDSVRSALEGKVAEREGPAHYEMRVGAECPKQHRPW